jgi:hypothetical protein
MPGHLDTRDDEQRVLSAILDVLRTRWHASTSVVSPVYPDAVPNLKDHLMQLIDIARKTNKRLDRDAELAAAAICSKCPFQFPSRYCPVRNTNECAMHELAQPILHAVRGALNVLES